MAASTAVKVLFMIVSLVIGIGIALYLLPELLPFLDEQSRIIIGVVLSLFAFISFYFMAKGSGG
jgi:hypothetical protein